MALHTGIMGEWLIVQIQYTDDHDIRNSKALTRRCARLGFRYLPVGRVSTGILGLGNEHGRQLLRSVRVGVKKDGLIFLQ